MVSLSWSRYGTWENLSINTNNDSNITNIYHFKYDAVVALEADYKYIDTYTRLPDTRKVSKFDGKWGRICLNDIFYR